MNIFVGNLLFEATEADLERLFSSFGEIASVAVIMEKSGKKSRGFGFVDMPDDSQAQAAIDALDGKEFMGRLLNVSPAHPKSDEDREAEKKKKKEEKLQAKLQEKAAEDTRNQDKTWFSPVFNKTGGYKGGRRSRSYAKKLAAAGITEKPKPRGKSRENPMRWRKRPKRWEKKPQRESGPYQQVEGESKPARRVAATRSNPDSRSRKPGANRG
jgi:RNA recognition motif-containing protein